MEVPRHHNRRLLSKCLRVTREDVLSALRTYLLPLFDPGHSVIVAVAAPNKSDEVAAALETGGFDVERRVVYAEPEGEAKVEADAEEADAEVEESNADEREATPSLTVDDEDEGIPSTPASEDLGEDEPETAIAEVAMSEKLEVLALREAPEHTVED